MKKLLSVSPLFLNIAFLFLPLCKLIAWLLDYRLTLCCYPAVIVILTVFLLVITILMRVYKTELAGTSLSFVTTLPLAFWIGWTFLILASNWKPALLCALLSAVCVFVLFLTYTPSRVVKVVLSVLLIPLIVVSFCLASLLAFVAADFGTTTVMQQIPSPDAAYIAEVLSIDEGALGGSTLVRIRHSKQYSFIIGKIEKNPQRVEVLDYGRTPQIEWLDDTTLLVNRTPYSIKE